VRPILELFLEKINISDNGCWEWQGCYSPNGYGFIRINGKNIKTHRFIYEHYCGELITNIEIHHKCENRKCCNPTHLESLSHKEHSQKHSVTHCKSGHEFTPESTYIRPDGNRTCRTCNANNGKQYRQNLRMMAFIREKMKL